MKDLIIIGYGPAGVSAALYAARAGVDTLMIGKDFGALGKAERIENFYGQAEPLSGPALAQNGIEQATRLGVDVVTGEVVGLKWDDCFSVDTLENSYTSRAVIIATGATRVTPGVEGLSSFEGRGVSYCAVCDAFFYRGMEVAVLGSGPYALHEVNDLLPLVKSVTVLTHGVTPVAAFPEGVQVITQPIKALTGARKLESVTFENGDTLAIAGLFVAVGVAGSTELAQKIGAVTTGGRIVVDDKLRTSVPGLWAAGDCVGGMKQIAKAVYEGACAGTEAIKYIREGR